MSDIYYTIREAGESQYKEKMSRFLSFAIPVKTADEAKLEIKAFQNKFHDARHVCWAYMIGPDRTEWQLNDNGEPSGTAGKPILGQINSFEVTDVLVIVVRYFGGIKLGTSGLIVAYREAARLALEVAGKKELCKMSRLHITFPYIGAEGVMKLVKGGDIDVIDRTFDNTCGMTIEIAESKCDELKERLRKIDGVSIEDVEGQ
ncbi:MAG: YigZ family protein [Muribaculaceae bacterium]|nr:YigZ family protein [Muribaculaceae bacterium]